VLLALVVLVGAVSLVSQVLRDRDSTTSADTQSEALAVLILLVITT
jgi:hypothetical protein